MKNEDFDNKDELQCIVISNDNLKVLDQTLLPNEVKYINITGTEDAWQVIKDMKVRGAPLIAVVALQGLKVELLKFKQKCDDAKLIFEFISDKSEYLKTSRPTAVNLTNDLDELLNFVKPFSDKNDSKQLFENFFQYIENNYKDYEKSSYEIARHGADIILEKLCTKSSISILTICNTGKLAMPGIGTALGIIREIYKRNKLKTLYIPETRPYNQGSRLTAFEALADKLPGVLISDSMAGMLMQNKMVDCVIVGADRVTKLGYTANKIGTYTFSVIAKHHKIPFYVACPVSTIDLKTNFGRDIIIEERPSDELRKIHGNYLSPKDINVWNPSFDVTPPSLIEKIITEKGAYEFDSNSSTWEELAPQKLKKYLIEQKLISVNEEVVIKDVADGNLNYVYCVRGEKEAYCVKQALPWVKCVGTSWPLSLDRTLYETEALKYQESICPEFVPKFIHYNQDFSLLIMEFLDDHIILRNGLINGIKYEKIGEKIGLFVARTCFFSSGLHLNPQMLRDQMSFWNGNTLCVLTEQVVFSDPYVDAPLNRWTSPQLDESLQQLRNDKEVISKIFKLRHKFISNKQALIHGDLHSGSIMVDSKGSCKIIDGEFSFYGPIGYDTGNVISHLLISYYTQKAHNKGDKDYDEWILKEIKLFWETFEKEFLRLWDDNTISIQDFPGLYQNKTEITKYLKKQYLQELFEDTLEYTATEIIRRIFGIAHVADFETINDKDLRAEKEKLALKMALLLLVNTKDFTTIDDVLKKAREINNI